MIGAELDKYEYKHQSTIEFLREKFNNIDKIEVEESSLASRISRLKLKNDNIYQDL